MKDKRPNWSPPPTQDLKSKVWSPFKCLNKTTCRSKISSFSHFFFLPHPPRYSLSSFLHPLGLSTIFSFALQVVALHLPMLPAIKAWQRLAISVHAPAVAPLPAFGWTALQRQSERFSVMFVFTTDTNKVLPFFHFIPLEKEEALLDIIQCDSHDVLV